MRLRHFLLALGRSEWTGLAAGLLFTFAIWAWARAVGTDYREPGVTCDGLFVDSKSLELGDVWEQRDFEWPIVVENRGPSTVEIVNWFSSCACTRITPKEIAIPPRSAAEVRLFLDLSAFVTPVVASRPIEGSGYRTEQLAGAIPRHRFSFYLRPQFSDSQSHGTEWVLAGVVRQALIADPSTVQFGEALVRGQRSEPVYVKLIPLAGTRVTGVRPDPQERVDFALTEAATGNWVLTVTPRTALAAGPFKTGAVIDLRLEPGGPSWPFALPIVGTVVERVRVVPDQVYLGSLRKGETRQVVLTLASSDSAPFASEPLWDSSRPEGSRLERRQATELHAYVLTLSALKAGQQSSRVEFRVRVGDDEPFIVAARINYYVLDSPSGSY